MKKTCIAFIAAILVSSAFALGHDKPPARGYGAWDAFLLGITTPELAAQVRSDVSNQTVRLAIANYGKRHDDGQIRELKLLARTIGLPLDIVPIPPEDPAAGRDLGTVYEEAVAKADLVIDYRSYWKREQVTKLVCAVACHPDTLFIAPYGEINGTNCPPTCTSFQGQGRKRYGQGLANLVLSTPLAPGSAGRLFRPFRRTPLDTAEIAFIAPSSFACSPGETCPSASVTAIVAAYAFAAHGEKPSARQLVRLLAEGAEFPQQMTELAEFDAAARDRLARELDALATSDALGRTRLQTRGILSIRGIRALLRTP